jgi:hypothetical protein
VQAPHTISVTFTQSAATITSSAGTGGTISPNGTQTVAIGFNQTYTITPNPGYHVLDVLVDGGSVGTVTSYTFTNVTANHTISATFEVNNPGVTVTYPTGGETITSGGMGTVVTWTTASPVSQGVFGVWAVSTGGSWTWLGSVNANGSASYSIPWGASVPAGSYRVCVAYAPPAGSWTTVVYSPASFTVTSGLAVISPNGGETLPAGGVGTTVLWTTGTPVATGVFGVWAVSSTFSWTWLGSASANGTASYSLAWTTAVPAGPYIVCVAYGPTAGTWTDSVYSAASFTVTP